MKKPMFLILSILSAALFVSMSFAAEPVKPSLKDKCPVCGMLVYPYPQFAAQILFKDGSYAAFDGPKDMLKYYFNIPMFNKKKSREDIVSVFLTEYYTTKIMKAEDLLFVIGSDVMGPMGPEIVPISGKKEAGIFMKDHHGKKIVAFSELAPSDIPGMK